MTVKWAAAAAIGGALIFAASGCAAPSANDAACKIFANSYNAYVGAANSEDWTSYKADQASMPGDFSDAYSKASGDVAVALKDVKDAAAILNQSVVSGASDTTSKNAIVLFQVDVSDVVSKCQADGVNMSVTQWKDSSASPTPSS